MRTSKQSFAETLVAGRLVFASNLAARKLHVVQLRRSARDDEVDGLSPRLSEEVRRAKIAEITARRRGLWSARALCGVGAERATFGNRRSYYWRAQQDPRVEDACPGCLREWKKLGEPEVAGWDRRADPHDAWPWELPFGWRVVPVEGHPWDVPRDVPVESVKDKTGAVVGEHRVELRRWMRGPCVVRLVHHLDTDTYAARHWFSGTEPGSERRSFSGPLQRAKQACHELMARGGY